MAGVTQSVRRLLQDRVGRDQPEGHGLLGVEKLVHGDADGVAGQERLPTTGGDTEADVGHPRTETGFKALEVWVRLGNAVFDLDSLERRVLEIYPIERKDLYSKSRQRIRAEVRSVFCYWAVRELGIEGTEVAKRLSMSQPGVVYAVNRGERIVRAKALHMIK